MTARSPSWPTAFIGGSLLTLCVLGLAAILGADRNGTSHFTASAALTAPVLSQPAKPSPALQPGDIAIGIGPDDDPRQVILHTVPEEWVRAKQSTLPRRLASACLRHGDQELPLDVSEIDNAYPEQVTRLAFAHEDGIFFVTRDYSELADDITLHVLLPDRNCIVTCDLEFYRDPGLPITKCRLSDNAGQPGLEEARDYLLNMRAAFGYLDEATVLARSSDPAYANYFWSRDNPDPERHPITIRTYPGRESVESSKTGEVNCGAVTFRSYLQEGVIGYDRSKDEHFTLYDSNDCDGWAEAMVRYHGFLLVAIAHYGIVVLDPQHRRFVNRKDTDFHHFTALAIEGDTLVMRGISPNRDTDCQRLPLASIIGRHQP
jgi:hypothetical protein